MSKRGTAIRRLVRRRAVGDKEAMGWGSVLRSVWDTTIDFALPPRCAGCGVIVAEVHSFCPDCWRQVEFLVGGCETCGLPLQATEMTICAACIARPPRLDRTRAAVAYDETSRRIAIRLKHGRKVALAKTMARYMAPLIDSDPARSVLVPVPLHPTRLWRRGFNQAAIIAAELSRATGIRSDVAALDRVKRTPTLKGLNALQRRKAVAGAFRAARKAAIKDSNVILVDDVVTTGSTANACARALKRAGAARVELVSWARVVRPTQVVR